MITYRALLVAVMFALVGRAADAGAPVVLVRDGWTVTADGDRGLLTVAHERLGPVLRDVRLNREGDRGAIPWTTWSAEQTPTQILVRTAAPASVWIVEPGRDTLRISTTAARALLTAAAPAPTARMIARLIDPSGVPVEWKGTAEVKEGYGGTETIHPSFLPARNSDVMYFALGQVSASTLHGLFDRKSDTAIRFSDETRMTRHAADANVLDLTVPVPGNTIVRLLPDYYATTLGVPFYTPFDDSRFERPPAIWCSWTAYYADAREDDIVRNTDWLSANLKDYGFNYVQIDDGYDRGPNGEHYWIEKWDPAKFPHGPKWMTAYIKSKGLHPGLWLVPNAYAGAVEAHPDWYLRNTKGEIIRDYSTPALDSTHPGVQAFLRQLFATLVDDWGFEYFKFDGEHALPQYAPTVDRSRLHDPGIDPVVAYRQRVALIREAIGPKTFVEGCPAGTPLNAIGYYNSFFNGDDVYNNWAGMYAFFSSINANAFWNHVVGYLMPAEGIDVGVPMTEAEAATKRPRSFIETARSRQAGLTGFGTTMAEARTLATYAGLTGVAYPLASVMPELPAERAALLQQTMPPQPILPIDLFSRGTDMRWGRFKDVRPDDYIHNYPEVLDLKVNAASGTYDVVAVTNWRGEPATRSLSFGDTLGLPAATRYAVFDYWQQRLLGVFTGSLTLEVEPHDTRVVLVHPLEARPQLVGNSRHISGAFSVLDVQWDASARTLRGTSQAVRGADYTVFVHVPRGMTVARVQASAAAGDIVPVRQRLSGELLSVTFTGRTGPVSWRIAFAASVGP